MVSSLGRTDPRSQDLAPYPATHLARRRPAASAPQDGLRRQSIEKTSLVTAEVREEGAGSRGEDRLAKANPRLPRESAVSHRASLDVSAPAPPTTSQPLASWRCPRCTGTPPADCRCWPTRATPAPASASTFRSSSTPTGRCTPTTAATTS